MRATRVYAAGAVLAAAALTAGCGSGGSSGNNGNVAGSHAPIKVGYLLPLTGVFTKNGKSEQDG